MSSNNDGDLIVTRQMRNILDRSGFISIETGSESLRDMFQKQFAKLNISKLSPFALACMCGDFDVVKEVITSGTSPDLKSTQTPFEFGFVSFAVLGAQRLRPVSSSDQPTRHRDVLRYLIDAGAPLDVPDVVGHTALHHACTPPIGSAEIAELLLDKGANVNAQNRYGEVPLFFPFQGGDIKIIDVLMAHGADLDIPDGNGDSPRKMCLVFGAQVTAAVQRWERKRKGEEAPLEEKRCENCKTKGSGLKQCARCHIVRYCSAECQRAHWKVHKPNCNPFSAQTAVTLKPSYNAGGFSETLSRADVTRRMFGLGNPGSAVPFRPGLTRNEAENKSMVIKVQVPMVPTNGALLIYNKKRDFVCNVQRESCPEAYDAVTGLVRSRGVGGAKAYLAAELKNADELVVKISEVLAEQPF